MKKNGFTLIEILGVITLLALLSVIIIMAVDKNLKDSKDILSSVQIENIKSAASMWRTDHIKLIPDSGYYYISLSELQSNGYINDEIINPKTNQNISDDLLIKVGLNDVIVDDVLINNGLRKLEYIESTGTQYIDTGFIPNQDTSIEVDGYTSSNKSLYGTEKGINGTGFNTNSTIMGFYYFTAYDGGYRSDIAVNIRHTFKQEKNKVYVDNNLLYVFNETTGSSNYPIFLFGRSYSTNGSLNDYGPGRIFSVKIWNDDKLVRNMIPCLRKSDNKAGLYDLVNNVFYDNSGTGDFVYKLPKDVWYTKLDYIESTGTQYIDTNYVPNSDTKVEMDFDSVSSAKWLFGSRTAQYNSDSFGVFLNYDTQYWIRIGTSEGDRTFDVPSTLGRHKIYLTGLDFTLDDIQKINYSANNTKGSYNLYIGTMNNSDTLDNRIFTGKIYGFKIYEKNQLVRNYVPCKRNSDNAIGLCDEINDIFYGSDSSSGFLAG